jgi:hypothetical protein
MPPAITTTSRPRAASRGQQVPTGAEGAANADRIADSELGESARYRADGADGVDQRGRFGRIAAQGDRHLAQAETIEHIELSRTSRRELLRGIERDSERIMRLAAEVAHHGDGRQHRRRQTPGFVEQKRQNARSRHLYMSSDCIRIEPSRFAITITICLRR